MKKVNFSNVFSGVFLIGGFAVFFEYVRVITILLLS
jgi:hypothetical protein